MQPIKGIYLTDDEIMRWAMLRSIEWGIWPAFLSSSVVPVLFCFFTWWVVLAIFIILTIMWSLIRYRYVNLTLAKLGVHLVMLKWITCPLSALYLVFHHNYFVALLALVWPLLAADLRVFVGGSKTEIIQKMFMSKLSYTAKE